jgi:phenylacetate-CoA ligase
VTKEVCTGSHREAILTSARNVGFLSDDRTLTFDERRVGRLLFLNERSSPLLWDDAAVRRMAGELESYSPEVLEANPSYLALFSREAARLGLPVAQPEVIVFTYENPSLLHLRQIRRVFGAPITSSYGTTEIGYAFMGCERGFHHLNSASCRVDFVPLEGAGPEVGSIRVTPFGNEWVSLLRFDPGDIVRIEETGTCPCGGNGAILLRSVEGRVKSLTRSTEGRPVTPGELDRALAEEESLLAYQLVEEKPGDFSLKAVLDEKGGHGATGRLGDALAGLYGRMARLRVEACEFIEPEASGKYLPAKSLAAARP